MTPDQRLQFELGITHLLTALGENTLREGLRETPARVRRFMEEFCVPKEFDFTTFDSEGMSEMIVQSPIPFYSLCEHHMLPFMGTATVGYIPNGRIAGLSKLARTVQYCAAGLKNQERITNAVAKMINDKLHPQGVGVIISARHMCMEMRGVKAHDAASTTSCLLGVFKDEASCRAEFMNLAHKEK